jgi:hypothetical protein
MSRHSPESTGAGRDRQADGIPPEVWDRLRRAFRTSDALHAWLHRPSRVLRGRTPADALEAGEVQQVLALLEALG